MPLATRSAAAEAVEVTRSGNQRIDALLYGDSWSGAVTFGFPTSTAAYAPGYPEPLTDFQRVNATQRAGTLAALTEAGGAPGHHGFSVEGFTRIDITYSAASDADIRLANTSDPDTAYTYSPADADYGGDSFFGASGRNPVTGNYDWSTLLHELGHALGLKHGNETGGFGALPSDTDSMEYSLMTYRSYVGADGAYLYNEPWGYPQTYMMYDIAALQYLYGADFGSNAGNTTYTWNPVTGETFVDGALALSPGGNRTFATIWDGNGIDTYDLSNYATDLRIDLAPGRSSTFSETQLADLGGGGNEGKASGNIYNALLYEGDLRSLIENAIGGSGDDLITGNQAANSLSGGAGADRLYGGAGADVLNGGTGADLMDGGGGNDRYYVDNAADLVVERLGVVLGGKDTVVASVDWQLGTNLDNLTLTGGARSGLGNNLSNTLSGSAGNDTLRGLGGNDRLNGGAGSDVLIGGPGWDVFRFGSVADSPTGAGDRLRSGTGVEAFQGAGAAGGDLIDLSAIDAHLGRAGNQDFVFGTSHNVGHLWAVDEGRFTVIYGNVSGGRAPEFQLVIEDKAIRAADYTVHDFIGLA